jgi:hypothetical protein
MAMMMTDAFSGVSMVTESRRISRTFLTPSAAALTYPMSWSKSDTTTPTTTPHAPQNCWVLQARKGSDDGYDGLGEYDPSEGLSPEREVVVGDPQIRLKEKERSVTSILKELAAIQQQGPQKYCILGTRHCSYLHQQIIELLYVK